MCSCIFIGNIFTFQPFIRNFAFIYGAGTSISFLSSLVKLVVQRQRPILSSILLNSTVLRIASTFGLLPALYSSVKCILNRILPGQESGRGLNAAIAGLCAGFSMLPYPSLSIALYLAWKFVEACIKNLISGEQYSM